MKRKVWSGKDLIRLGFPESKAVSLALNTIHKHFRKSDDEVVLPLLAAVLANPADFTADEQWGVVAQALLPAKPKSTEHALLPNRIEYAVFGAAGIEAGARHQMEIAMKLPVTVAGALMPDAHQGYGLPIGGVLATNNAVIPYGVGVDIGCRMCMSVFDVNAHDMNRHRSTFKQLLLEHTYFGHELAARPQDHEVLNRKLFSEIPLLKTLQSRAARQIGSSGSGNHFVEFGLVTLLTDNPWQVPAGQYMTVLSHSGSRGLGAEIARHYTKVAKANCLLPREAENLAWLDLDTEDGQAYWQAMNLAGDYASANHHQIHDRLSKVLGESVMIRVENHHNFAWKELLADGREVIVHRKGATPAGDGVLGIIPGSMTAPGYVVRGKGSGASLQSASHGAGRTMSRSAAKQSVTQKMMRQELERYEVELLGGGLDESPMAYKNIRQVMAHQEDLVEVLGVFEPKIVRMCGDDSPAED